MATPVPHVHEIVEHGKHGMYHLKDKTVDAVEVGVENVKHFAAAGVGAVKTAGSKVADVVSAPFYKMGHAIHKILPGHHEEDEEHIDVPSVTELASTPDHAAAVVHEEHNHVEGHQDEEHKPVVTGN